MHHLDGWETGFDTNIQNLQHSQFSSETPQDKQALKYMGKPMTYQIRYLEVGPYM